MVILGGLELVAAGYLLKELHGDSKEDEKERERRRRRRHHSRDDHRPHRHDDSPPSRPSRPPQQLLPPQQGPSRPYSAPPPKSRPQMLPVAMAATAAQMWPGRPHQGPPPPQQGMPPSHGTWPQGPPQQNMQQRPPPQPQPQGQWQSGPIRPPQNGSNGNFVAPPLQRPPTNYPPPGVHIDMKTGKVQHDMFPPEMPRKGEAREYYEGGSNNPRQDFSERRRENSFPNQQSQPQLQQRPSYPPQSYSQPQISVSPPPSFHAPSAPHGFHELDSETPGRFRDRRDEKSRRGRANSDSRGRYDDNDDYDRGMRSPPPAYRE